MDKEKVREIEEKIAELKSRWPAHSVPPSMWQQLEELEGELEEARKTEGIGGEADFSPFNNLASEYDAWFDRDGGLVFSIEVRAFQALLPSLPKPWLEIGVGSGRFARALGIETGLDPSLRLVKMAGRRGISALLGWGEKSPLAPESAGTIFLVVTLCFLDSPLDVLKEARRILAPGGRLVLGLVLKESPWGRFYRQKKDEGHRFYRFATFYNRDEVAELLAQAGFITERTISTLFQGPGRVQSLEEPREGYFPDAGFTVIAAGATPAVDSMARRQA